MLKTWTRKEPLGRRKTFRLGSEAAVFGGEDKGFLSTVMAAYNNHWVLRTRPEDWWTTVSQIIAVRIDRHAEDEKVREFFVSHQGKKPLTVEIGPSLEGINNEKFFSQMISQISENLNKPEYTKLMASDFSQSTPVDRIVNSLMLMFSFQEYFEYRALLACGIPGVIMDGSEEDWQNLVYKLEGLEEFLQPLEDVLRLSRWFSSAKVVLNNLVDTFRGNPDRKWWSRIMDRERSFGSGGGQRTLDIIINDLFYKSRYHPGKSLTGWFVTDFLGMYRGNLGNVPSGLNLVPLTLTDGNTEEQAALVAGVTGYNITEDAVIDQLTNTTFPSIQTVHGWALLVDQNTNFN